MKKKRIELLLAALLIAMSIEGIALAGNRTDSSAKTESTSLKAPRDGKEKIENVTVDTSNAKTIFLRRKEIPYAEGLKITVDYENEKAPETLTFKYESVLYDSYGNAFSYYFWVYDNGGYQKIEPGTQSLNGEEVLMYVECNGEGVQGRIPVTLTDDPKEALPELKVGTNQIESPKDHYKYYWFCPTESGKYIFDHVVFMDVKKFVKLGDATVDVYGYDSIAPVYRLEKDEIYEVGFYDTRSIEDENGDIIEGDSWKMNIAKCPDIDSLDVTEDALTYTYGLDQLNEYDPMLSARVQAGYRVNGTYKTIEVMPFFNDFTWVKYGDRVRPIIQDENGRKIGSEAFDENGNLKVGTYQYSFVCDNQETKSVKVTVKPFDYNSIPKLKEGKNKIELRKEYNCNRENLQDYYIWYALETENCAKWTVTPQNLNKKYFTATWKKIDGNGNAKDVHPKKSGDSWMLDKHSRYLVCYSVDWKAGIEEKPIKRNVILKKWKPTIKLNVPDTIPLQVKQSFQIKVSGLARGDEVSSWKSSNTKVVTVSSKGKITGKKAGNAIVTVKLKSGLTSKIKVKVQKSEVQATSITVWNQATKKKISSTVRIKAKKRITLAVTLAPVTCKQKITYSTSNKKVATVSAKGVITARKKGTTTIRVKAGRKIKKIKVKVN